MTTPLIGSDMLERMIDSYGLETVLRDIARICSEKAEHVAVNWQDTTLAKAWEYNSMLIERTKIKPTI